MRLLLPLLVVLLLFGCKRQPQNTSSLIFDFPGNPDDTVQIYHVNPLDFSQQDMGMSILDPAGTGEFELQAEDYTFVSINLAGNIRHVLLYPGGSLHISASEQDPSSVEFEGEGAEANTYLTDLAEIFSRNSTWNGKSFHVLDSVAFFERQEKIDREIVALRSGFSADLTDSDRVLQLLDLEAEFRKLLDALQNEMIKQRRLPVDARSLLEDHSGLSSGSVIYPIALALFYNSRVSGAIVNSYSPEAYDSIAYLYPELAYDEIQSLETSEQVKELLSARILYDHFSDAELNPVLLDTYARWKNAYPDSEYLALLDQKLSTIQQLGSGIPAPEIRGITPEGDSLRLSDLKGKVVYIKVWATWCSPCIKSFPDLNALASEMSGRELAVLCISPDRDEQKWRKFLDKNEVAGIHISVESERFRDDYLVTGIPRYILIDPEGRIADPNAPSPEKAELRDEINDLIGSGG